MGLNRLLGDLAHNLDSAAVGSYQGKSDFSPIAYSSLSGTPSTILDSAAATSIVDSAYINARQASGFTNIDSALASNVVDSAYINARIGGGGSGFFVYEFETTAGQTAIQDSDLNGNLMSYTTEGILVFKNGVLLLDSDDYTATDGSVVTLTSAADSGSNITISKFVLGGGGGSSGANGTGDRGFHWGGVYVSGDYYNQIDYWDITTTGNAADFGDCYDNRNRAACTSDGTYAIAAGGNISTGRTDNIEYITTATLANATSFGTLSTDVREAGAASNGTKGLIMGGQWTGTTSNTIEYITIATPGNASDHGDLVLAGQATAGGAPSNGTYGYYATGAGDGGSNYYARGAAIDYVAIATPGNASDHGDLTHRKLQQPGAAWDNTYALWAGGANYGTGTSVVESVTNKIDYITMGTSGNGTDFGDLTTARHSLAGCTNATRGTFQAGNPGSSPYNSNVIDYVTIATPGNATDFGDLSRTNYESGSTAGSPS